MTSKRKSPSSAERIKEYISKRPGTYTARTLAGFLGLPVTSCINALEALVIEENWVIKEPGHFGFYYVVKGYEAENAKK